jgi:hypothetical protein
MSLTNHEVSTVIEHVEAAAAVRDAALPSKRASTGKRRRIILRTLGLGLVSYVLVVVGLGVYWSLQPAVFDVRANALEEVGGDEPRLVPGAVTVAAAIRVAETLLDKPGGWTYNDFGMPGLYLDNVPSWEDGALKELRDSVRSLRNDFSRSQTQSIESPELKAADAHLNFDMRSWALPPAEIEYRKGVEELRAFFKRLTSGTDPTARFHTRADNLAAYLAVVEKRLGSLAQRLSASVGDDELTAALVHESEGGKPSSDGSQIRGRTSWLEVDNIFHEARGYTWALLHMTSALSIDFKDVLRDKNAEVSMQQVIRDLRGATGRMWSPMVLNGTGFGLLANHSLVMASYISRANAAVLDLRVLLQQG